MEDNQLEGCTFAPAINRRCPFEYSPPLKSTTCLLYVFCKGASCSSLMPKSCTEISILQSSKGMVKGRSKDVTDRLAEVGKKQQRDSLERSRLHPSQSDPEEVSRKHTHSTYIYIYIFFFGVSALSLSNAIFVGRFRS
jgi:hypothetical protein